MMMCDWTGFRRLSGAGALIVAIIGYGGCVKVGAPGVSDSGGGPADAALDGAVAPDAPMDRGVTPADTAAPMPGDSGVPPAPCVNLQCQKVNCAGPPTSISGTVFAPNGKLPLYNVTVYVPNAPLDPFPAGITCDRCGAIASGKPIAVAVSDSQGKFKINNVPVGANIPLVFQVGKWRRKVAIPTVTACQDNALGDANLTRLPRNRQEGDIPRIAVTTGACDQLGCLLPKLGIDAAELGVAGENKAVSSTRRTWISPGRSRSSKTPPSVPRWGSALRRCRSTPASPRGRRWPDWMQFLDPAIAYGRITAMAPSALAWASSPTLLPGAVDAGSGNLGPRIVTVNTPAGLAADKQCGRAAFLDAHITTDARSHRT